METWLAGERTKRRQRPKSDGYKKMVGALASTSGKWTMTSSSSIISEGSLRSTRKSIWLLVDMSRYAHRCRDCRCAHLQKLSSGHPVTVVGSLYEHVCGEWLTTNTTGREFAACPSAFIQFESLIHSLSLTLQRTSASSSTHQRLSPTTNRAILTLVGVCILSRGHHLPYCIFNFSNFCYRQSKTDEGKWTTMFSSDLWEMQADRREDLILPCRHLVTFEECASSYRVTCNVKILGKVLTYVM